MCLHHFLYRFLVYGKLQFLKNGNSISDYPHLHSLLNAYTLDCRLSVLCLTGAFRGVNPEIAISAHYQAYVLQLQYVRFHASDVIMVYFHEEAIAEAPILGSPCLQGYLAIHSVDSLHFCTYNVSFFEELTHLHLIFFGAPALQASRQVDVGDVQDGVLVGVDVHGPALVLYRDDAAYDHVSRVRLEALLQWAHTYHFINAVDDASQGGVDAPSFLVGAVTSDEALVYVVTWDD